MFKAVIYDLDGTLVDTTRMNTASLQMIVREELHKEIPYEELKRYMAFSGTRTLELLGIQNIDQVYPRWVRYVHSCGILAETFPGVKETLEMIHETGILQAVMSSKRRDQYKLDIVDTGLDSYFCAKTLAEDTQNHKPSVEPMHHILNQLQLQADEVLYVGDTEIDWRCCRDSNVAFAYASWGPLPLQKQADYVLRIPQDLYEILKV